MMRKRARMGIGNDAQWQWQKDRMKRYELNLAKLNRNLYVSYISRWQSLTEFTATPCAMQLGLVVNTTTGVRNLPLYAFDLSSMTHGTLTPDNSAQVNIRTWPMYRMRCDKSNISTVSENVYQWDAFIGKKNDPTGALDQYPHTVEDVTGVLPDLYPIVDKHIHEWSDIRMVINGLKQQPCRVHAKLIRWKQREFAPPRYYNVAGSTAPVLENMDTVGHSSC